MRSPNISKSVARYQLSIDEAKVHLDFAVQPAKAGNAMDEARGKHGC